MPPLLAFDEGDIVDAAVGFLAVDPEAVGHPDLRVAVVLEDRRNAERLLVLRLGFEVRRHLVERSAFDRSGGAIAVVDDVEARIGIDELLQAALRMRPDRLLVGEIRGPEGFTFLRAVNTGHPGSMTTVHADSPRGALDQIAFMALQAGVNLSRDDVIAYARDVIDVVVQLARVAGRRVVSTIAFNKRL